jgi:FdrA protein
MKDAVIAFILHPFIRMSITKYQIRPGYYCDSVVLMQLQKSLLELPAVVDAGAVMATPANRALLQVAGFAMTGIEARPDDLLIMVKAENEPAATHALEQVDTLLRRRQSAASQDFRPRSLSSAAKALPGAQWVLISVPGRYAAGVAEEALDLDKHVFLYSDNVSLEDEIRLKQTARDKGLLLMGPDCGTAIINGVGLGFANRVRRGNIGVVAASGTGLQVVTASIHNLGGGISQAIGTGGRDLKAKVGGTTALQAIDLLGRDPETKVIVLISKPPDAAVVTQLLNAAQSTAKPVIVDFLAYPPLVGQSENLHFAISLNEAADIAVEIERLEIREGRVKGQSPVSSVLSPYLRGLFSGGTLAYEALFHLQGVLSPLYSNIAIRPEQRLGDSLKSQSHTILDLGEDEFTQGRLHPMMDNDLRLRRLRQEVADPEVGLILLDVVLGAGAHSNPAAELAPAISQIRRERELEVVAIVVGTDEDPQDLNAQVEQLEGAGAIVFTNAADAIGYVGQRLRPTYHYDYPRLPLKPFNGRFAGINVGLESFYDSLKSQEAEAVHVEWRPPAGGNEKLMSILAKMKK